MSPIAGLARVGLLGGGVIGGGWAARFLLHGVDVTIHDPDPDAPRKVGDVLANGRRAMAALINAPLPPEGRLTFVATPEAAVDGADYVQESAPERLDLKRDLLGRADAVAGDAVVIGSSTSGLRPTLLQRGMVHPHRLVVGHPFNPVYLLPLVEICAGDRRDAGVMERAASVYRAVGMHPLVLEHEIDGFVADRLLEALWREALWLVEDGVATVSEIDDAIRFGAGLRWSAMGTFLIYRMAGGEAGMRHFMEQFGPALKWPWSRLTDVPELTDELLDRVAAQSDEQAAGRSIGELEALRDDCLVAVIRGLHTVGVGAGRVLADHERVLAQRELASSDRSSSVHQAATSRVRIERHDRHVAVGWGDVTGEFHHLWLRDNCPCPVCVHSLTGERVLDTFTLDPGVSPIAVTAVEGDRRLLVEWTDGHHSAFDLAWLRAHAGPPGDDLPVRRHWGAEIARELPELAWRDLDGDDGLRCFVETVWLRGLVFVRGVPATEEATRTLARRVGHVRETNFGVDWHVVARLDANNVAYTSVELRPHTDLPNRETPPGVQFLHCLRSDAPGGDTTLVDGFWIADRIRGDDPDAFAILAGVPIPYRFHDDDHDLRWSAPVIGLDARGGYREVRFHDALTSPLDLPLDRVEPTYAALRRFHREATSPAARLTTRLAPGDLMVFDNRRILHGRRAFDAGAGERDLFGLYVDHDEWRSRLRMLRR